MRPLIAIARAGRLAPPPHRSLEFAMSRVSVIVAACMIAVAAAQQPPSPPAPVYTAAQAEAGRAAYDISCSGCHLPDLRGSFEAPQLTGSNFLNQWGDKTISDLYTYL